MKFEQISQTGIYTIREKTGIGHEIEEITKIHTSTQTDGQTDKQQMDVEAHRAPSHMYECKVCTRRFMRVSSL